MSNEGRRLLKAWQDRLAELRKRATWLAPGEGLPEQTEREERVDRLASALGEGPPRFNEKMPWERWPSPVPTIQDIADYWERVKAIVSESRFLNMYLPDGDIPPQSHPEFRGSLHVIRSTLEEVIAGELLDALLHSRARDRVLKFLSEVARQEDCDDGLVELRQLHIDAGRLMGPWLHRRLMSSAEHDLMAPAPPPAPDYACQCGANGRVFGGCFRHDLSREEDAA